MNYERGFGPSPESRYNPHTIMEMTHRHSFQAQMPGIVRDVARLPDHFAYSPTLKERRGSMRTLLTNGPREITDILYDAYALGHEWSQPVRHVQLNTSSPIPIFQPIQVIQPMLNLERPQKEKWDWFMDTGEVPRRVAIDVLSIALLPHFWELPPIEPASDPVLESIGTSLAQAPFQIVDTILPDLRDEEAHMLFTNYTAEDIKRIAQQANRTE
ncbi:MAG TPA: hypothetical protein VLF93_06180 [Candidatus Saccharimonadales bacterium]|nr:hypothetical protein [Candidatus Saccharimonadales bacterium]